MYKFKDQVFLQQKPKEISLQESTWRETVNERIYWKTSQVIGEK